MSSEVLGAASGKSPPLRPSPPSTRSASARKKRRGRIHPSFRPTSCRDAQPSDKEQTSRGSRGPLASCLEIRAREASAWGGRGQASSASRSLKAQRPTAERRASARSQPKMTLAAVKHLERIPREIKHTCVATFKQRRLPPASRR